MELVAAFSRFVTDTEPRQAFVLNGYAGTGKTSLTSALVRSLSDIGIRTILLAPTGRAAKVFAAYSGHGASTIHHHIYQSRKFDPQAMAFNLKRNNFKNTYFIVDEASMISNHPGEYAVFGTGRLLDDLITYVYEGEGCRLILLGDVAQLPPVGYTDSPALSPEILHSYHLTVYSYTLTDVARQRHDSGILHNATTIRKIISSGELEPPVIRTKGYNDIEVITGEFLSEKIEECYDSDGIDETIIITRSNKRAVMFNQGVRGRVLYMESEICSGDMLLVAKNNYHWADNGDVEMDFIANGDVAIVKRMRSTSELYGFRFADVTLEFPDYHCEFDAKIILDALYSDTPALSREQNERLLNNVMEDYADIPRRAERFKKLKQDPYFNALQVKFAYSVTCHKAQGGQWKNVFIDMGYIPEEAYNNIDFYRWLYTSFTRAYGKIYLINPPLQTE
ncbi:MAG: AAA family ATPase [Bacteroidetes bacterium]|uniref:AAA family ATPase n=1 Tax=Candidatus Limisoma faecipullorum TaxID=2840854 RepID=A0A9D9IPR7_9BACT|nr:AAA family ATPase [Candidatus Limisoma faecipullorum]